MAGADWQKLAREDKLKEAVPAAFDLGKDRILLVRLDGHIYACGGKCTHYGGPLEKGLLTRDVATCPWHNARFDVTNGKMIAPPALDHLRCYETKVEDGDVYVRATARPKPTMKSGTDRQTFVIVGAGAAGNAAAETLRKEGFGGRVVVVTPEKDLPYDRPNLSKDYLAGKAKAEWIPLRSEKFYAENRIEFITERRVVAVDPKGKRVTLEGGEPLGWDRLLLATGGKPRRLEIPGAELAGVFVLRSRADAEAIIKALAGVETAVVIGGSFIGMEVASALAQRKIKVHVVARDEVPMARVFGEPVGSWLTELHEAQGVTFHLGRRPVHVGGSERAEEVKLDNGDVIEAQLVVAGIGITPVVDYLAGTGLATEDAVAVNERLETRAEGIFAAGDIALAPCGALGQRIRVEHWAVAERQGQHAARTMLGSREPYGEIPFFWTHQYDKSLSYAGHAKAFDRIAYRGDVGDDGFVAGYYRSGKLEAVASLWRDIEFMTLAEILKSGRQIPFEQFEDEKADIGKLLPR